MGRSETQLDIHTTSGYKYYRRSICSHLSQPGSFPLGNKWCKQRPSRDVCSIWLVRDFLQGLGDNFLLIFTSLISCCLQSRLQWLCVVLLRSSRTQWPRFTLATRFTKVNMPIHSKLQNTECVTALLCKAKCKFPDHQKIHNSKQYSFAKFYGNLATL